MIFIICIVLVTIISLNYKKTIITREVPYTARQYFNMINGAIYQDYGDIPDDGCVYMAKVFTTYSEVPYLIRYTLFTCKFFSIKIHKALISDPEEPHDHPWNYLSFILRGGYWEERKQAIPRESADQTDKYWNTHLKWYKPGSILYRKGDQLHKLIIPENSYCISLIFTFKKWRKWGYLKNNRWEQYQKQ